jgi:hypothetical protein
MSQSFAGISSRTGGGFTCAFGTWEAIGIDIEYGGPMTHASRIVGGVTETGSQLLVMHSVDKAQAVILRYYSYDKHGGPTPPAKLIDVTCNNVSLDFYGCGLVSGASAGLSMSITDSSNGGYVTFAGQCYSGMNAYTLTGVTLDDQGTVWDLGYPTETLTNSYVTARNAQYSTPGLNGGTSRVAKRTVTLSGSAANPDIPTYGDATLYATVASGTVTIDGFIAGIEGYRIRLIVEGFVAVNVLNNSASETTAANKILTPTGGTLNLNPAGANAYTVMDFAYDSASARWRFMP